MKRIVAACLFVLLSGQSAHAQMAPQHPNQAPCLKDFTRFCDAVPPGQGRKIACLRSHKSQLAPACRERLDAVDAIIAANAARRAKMDPKTRAKVEAGLAAGPNAKGTVHVNAPATPTPAKSSGSNTPVQQTPAPKSAQH
jgi:hypothetical protein